MLVDIAGLDDPASALDAQVQAQARAAMAEAEFLLLVDDGRYAAARDLWPRDIPRLRVRTKCDLGPCDARDADLRVSGVTGQGIAALRQAVANAMDSRAISPHGEGLALQPRHEQALHRAVRQLDEAAELVRGAGPQPTASTELVAAAMREALNALSSLGGQMTPDDVLGRVFGRFCIGK
jgi:tRNA modification GTPase